MLDLKKVYIMKKCGAWGRKPLDLPKLNNGIGQTDREQIHRTVLYAVDKGLRGRNVLHQLLLILLCICS